jgi:hypothetical protein
VINIFGEEQHRIMAQMHQEIQLLISVFIIAVSTRPMQPPVSPLNFSQSLLSVSGGWWGAGGG